MPKRYMQARWYLPFKKWQNGCKARGVRGVRTCRGREQNGLVAVARAVLAPIEEAHHDEAAVISCGSPMRCCRRLCRGGINDHNQRELRNSGFRWRHRQL